MRPLPLIARFLKAFRQLLQRRYVPFSELSVDERIARVTKGMRISDYANAPSPGRVLSPERAAEVERISRAAMSSFLEAHPEYRSTAQASPEASSR